MREIKNSAVLARARDPSSPFTSRAAGTKLSFLSLFLFPSLSSFASFSFPSTIRRTTATDRPTDPFSRHPPSSPHRFAELHYQRHIRNLIERLVKNRVSKGWNSIRFERIVSTRDYSKAKSKHVFSLRNRIGLAKKWLVAY